MKFSVFLLSVLVLAARPLFAQVPEAAPDTHCLLLPLDPAIRLARATRVVEAAVTASQGFRAANGQIYTRHQLQVFRQFKGPAAATLTVLTEGGTVGLRRDVLTNTLQLEPGEQGVFFLEAATLPEAAAAWQVYGSQQGFIRYNLTDLSAAEPFRHYPAVDGAFYEAVAAAPPREIQPNTALAEARQRRTAPANARPQAAAITKLAPLSLTAGTGAELTITGKGFGSSRGTGTVEFRNADDGGDTYTRVNDDDYLDWTDTQIQVRVPGLSATGNPAGTGPVRVTPAGAGQLPVSSPGAVTIVFAATNVRDTKTKQRARPAHRDQNGEGGLTFRFDPDFAANSAATAAWKRALTAWRCQTGINWSVGPPRTKSGAVQDGENSVGFDTDAQLPANVLGRTTSRYQGYYRPDGSVVFFVNEIDTQYDDDTDFQFGPAKPLGSQIDFETVAVHELGHAQQLSHLILPSAIMHYSISRGQQSRKLSSVSDVAGGRYVLRTRSFQPDPSGPAAMLPAPLIDQQVELSTNGITLTWNTRDECYLSGFVVERAPVDTTAGWQPVATVAAGGSGNQYSALDPEPLSGLSYYRLRVRRPNGSLDTARPLLITDEVGDIATLRIFPNPISVGSLLSLQYGAGPATGSLRLQFYDAIGRNVGSLRTDYQPSLNLLRVTPPILRSGYYLLRWTDSNGPKGTTPLLVE